MRRHIILLLLLIFIVFIKSDTIAQQWWVYQPDVKIYSRIKQLKMSDNISLEFSEFTQDTLALTKKPCILYCTGFGETGPTEVSTIGARSTAAKGYYTATYRMRGQGFSGGYSELISTLEMKDLIEVVNYIKSGDYANPDKIAIVGSSQGGILSLMACSNGLKVSCIVSDLMSPDFASDWILNGSIKMTLLWSLSYQKDKVNYSEKVKRYRSWILKSDGNLFDSLEAELPLNRNFSNLIGNCTVPVLMSNAWGDFFFSSNGIIKKLSSFRNENKFFIGPINGHGSVSNQETEKYHNDIIQNWIHLYLNDEYPDKTDSNYTLAMTSIADNKEIYFMYSSNTNPFSRTRNINFFFNDNKNLSSDIKTGKDGFYQLTNSITNPALSLERSVNMEFKGAEFDAGFLRDSIVLISDPLQYNYNFAGIPYADLYYSSDNNICQFNIKIFESTASGDNVFITSINFTDRKAGINTIKKFRAEGNSAAHIFSQGNRIKILITNIDTRPDNKFLRTNPFVLPVMKNFKGKLYFGKKNPSCIILPILENK